MLSIVWGCLESRLFFGSGRSNIEAVAERIRIQLSQFVDIDVFDIADATQLDFYNTSRLFRIQHGIWSNSIRLDGQSVRYRF